MKKKWIKRLCLHVGLALMSATPSLTGQTLDFVRFQPENISNTQYDYINIDAMVFNTDTGVRVCIYNNTSPTAPASATRPTVARIYFDASSEFLSANPTFNAGLSSSGVSFQFGGSPGDLPGGNEIGFSADSWFTATPPPPKDGLNPWEYACFDFAGTDYDKLISGLISGEVRFGVHVLQVGPRGEDSLSLVNKPMPPPPVIPEPSVVLLGAVGMIALLRRRR